MSTSWIEVRRVAVIGAGMSGLAAIKQCLDEHLEPVCYEQRTDLGGLWNYSETVVKGRSSVMKNTVANVCKETYCYSDFPVPAVFPVFLPHYSLLEYLRLYANKFGLGKYIQFDTEVVSIRQTGDFSSTGRWQITLRCLKTDVSSTEIFDAVLMCCGRNSIPQTPQYEGANLFKGIQMNASDYRHSDGFEGKRVLVMGIGNSAMDIACDLSRVCRQVYLSTRGGSWMVGRLANSGTPLDLHFNRRIVKAITRCIPSSLMNYLFVKTVQSRFDHARFGLEPAYTFTNHDIVINDELPYALLTGKVKIKCGVTRFTESAILFLDGSIENNIDAIVYATGYKFAFSNLKHPAFELSDGQLKLYKLVFAPDLWPPTIAAIGFVKPLGSVLAAVELQVRWAIAVFKGQSILPSKDEMWKHVQLSRKNGVKKFGPAPELSLNNDFNAYMDSIAEEIGCKPNIRKLLWTDPVLALALIFGPTTPFDYRLVGPGAWPPARQTILSLWDRIETATRTRKIDKMSSWRSVGRVLNCFICAIILFLVFVIFV